MARVSREFREAAKKELRRQRRLRARESWGAKDVISKINEVIRALDKASQDLLDAEGMIKQGQADPKVKQVGQVVARALGSVQSKLGNLAMELAKAREKLR